MSQVIEVNRTEIPNVAHLWKPKTASHPSQGNQQFIPPPKDLMVDFSIPDFDRRARSHSRAFSPHVSSPLSSYSNSVPPLQHSRSYSTSGSTSSAHTAMMFENFEPRVTFDTTNTSIYDLDDGYTDPWSSTNSPRNSIVNITIKPPPMSIPAAGIRPILKKRSSYCSELGEDDTYGYLEDGGSNDGASDSNTSSEDEDEDENEGENENENEKENEGKNATKDSPASTTQPTAYKSLLGDQPTPTHTSASFLSPFADRPGQSTDASLLSMDFFQMGFGSKSQPKPQPSQKQHTAKARFREQSKALSSKVANSKLGIDTLAKGDDDVNDAHNLAHYYACTKTIKHKDYPSELQPSRTILCVVSGRKHTWDALDWVCQNILLPYDQLVILSMIKPLSYPPCLASVINNIISYTLARTQKTIELTVEIAMEEHTPDTIAKVYSMYLPTMVVVGIKRTEPRTRKPRSENTRRMSSIKRAKIPLGDFLIQKVPVPVIYVSALYLNRFELPAYDFKSTFQHRGRHVHNDDEVDPLEPAKADDSTLTDAQNVEYAVEEESINSDKKEAVKMSASYFSGKLASLSAASLKAALEGVSKDPEPKRISSRSTSRTDSTTATRVRSLLSDTTSESDDLSAPPATVYKVKSLLSDISTERPAPVRSKSIAVIPEVPEKEIKSKSKGRFLKRLSTAGKFSLKKL